MRTFRAWPSNAPHDNEPVSVGDNEGPREAACRLISMRWDGSHEPDDVFVTVDDGETRTEWLVEGESVVHWSARPVKKGPV